MIMLRAVLLCLIWPTIALADIVFVSDKVTVVTYDVSGSTLRELRDQMKDRGPNGYWGYAKTNWNWDAQCNMRFRAVVTMPELTTRKRLSKTDLAVWDRMIANLHAHEMEHVEIGRNWAREIKLAGCVREKVAKIDARYRDADAELDRRTDHGRRTGVHLQH